MAHHNFPYLNDTKFLLQFDKQRVKEQYVRITSLNYITEDPIANIDGFVTGGSINIDGSSAMRRTANLSLITQDEYSEIDIKKLLAIDKKVEVLIGFKNTTNKYKQYPILWFPQGIYVIVSNNFSTSSAGTTISLGLHDKMALLNGECGGIFPAAVVLSERYDTDEYGETLITQPTIYQIIQQVVNHFGEQDLGRIIISDIPQRIKKVMKWMGSYPVYLYQAQAQSGNISYNSMSTNYSEISQRGDGNITMFSYGQDIGYIYTDFVYPNELVAQAGATIVSVLDQIKNLLGNYEYFYDIDGNFRFQEIKNYLNTSYTKDILQGINVNSYLVDYTNGKSIYSFEGDEIVQSYTNTPQYQQIKNDFIVWGKRTSISGADVPIRYHLAIDKKPKVGNSYLTITFEDPDDGIKKTKVPLVFSSKSAFPDRGTVGTYYYDNTTKKVYRWSGIGNGYQQTKGTVKTIKSKDFRTQLYLEGAAAQPMGADTNYYYTELKNEWPKLYDMVDGHFLYNTRLNPSDIDFFLDFIDTNGPLNDFSIQNIGRRTLVINDDSINCIFEPSNPDIVYINRGATNIEELINQCQTAKQEYLILDPGIYEMLMNGGVLKSAYQKIRTELYQYTDYNEQISLTVLPIYYLEPNTRITVKNEQTGIDGDYIIKTISLPLDINGTMSLSCTKALERI